MSAATELSDEMLPLAAYADEPAVAAEVNGAEPRAPLRVVQPAEGAAALAAEQSVLGSLLLGAPWTDVASVVRAEDYSPKHRLIVVAIGAVVAEGKPLDVITASQQLERTGHLVAAGGLAYLSELARTTPGVAHAAVYARAVREAAIKRRLPEGHRDADAIAQLRRDLGELQALKSPVEPERYPIERLDTISATVRTAVLQGLGLDLASVNAVIGAPNSGKTAFTVSGAVHIAAGCTEWLGLKITPGPVLFIAAEAPGSVKMRARAAAARLANPAAHLPLYITGAVPALGDEQASAAATQQVIATARYIDVLEDQAVVLIVIDTLASCLGGGPENGDGMVSLTNAAKAIAAATGACVVLLHHPSKGDGSSARGHTSLAAACDSIILVEKESETGEARTATLTKARDHATGAQLRFSLRPVALPDRDSFGDPLTTVVVEPATGIPVQYKRPAGKNQDTLLTDLERQHRTGKTHWTEAEILQAAKGLGMDRNRNAPRNALRALVAAGFVSGSPASYSLKYPPESTP